MTKLSYSFFLGIFICTGFAGCSGKDVNSPSTVQGEVDCNGIAGGSAFVDNCSKCVGGSTGLSACVQDCNGTWGGLATIDSCGDCVGGDTEAEPCPLDCNLVPRGEAYIDECGDCVGGNTGKEPCAADCSGEYGGTAVVDDCGDCVGGQTGLTPCDSDCAGVLGGQAVLDQCGECTGGTTNVEPCLQDCQGVWGGEAAYDDCGLCDTDSSNDNQTCTPDCLGVWGGLNGPDLCGICDDNPANDNTTCSADCRGIWNGPNRADDCGVCDAIGANDNTTCSEDCNGVWGGASYRDSCGVCDANPGNDNSSCEIAYDCNGQAYNGASQPSVQEDDCGVCDDDPSNDNQTCPIDCAGILFGPNYKDDCGVCDDDQTNNNSECEPDCNGDWAGEAAVDQCGDCTGGNTGKVACAPDCAGVLNGSAVRDQCGNCYGGTTGLPACVQDCTGRWGGTATMVNCNGQMLCKETTNLFFCDENCSTYLDCTGTCNGSATLDMCGVCNLDPSDNCVPDCAGVPGGVAQYDECGTCDDDPANDCGILAFLPGYGLKEAAFVGDRLLDIRSWEVTRSQLPVEERCSIGANNSSDRCPVSYLNASDIADPNDPQVLASEALLFRVPPQAGWGSTSDSPLYMTPAEVAVSADEKYLFLAGIGGGTAFVELFGTQSVDAPDDGSDPINDNQGYFRLLRQSHFDPAGALPEDERGELYVNRPLENEDPRFAVSVATSGDYIFVVYGASQFVGSGNSNLPTFLQVMKVVAAPNASEPRAAQVSFENVASLNLPSGIGAWDIAIDGNFAFLASGPDGVSVVDISDPTNPTLETPISFLPGTSWTDPTIGNIAADASVGYERISAESGLLIATTTIGGHVFDVGDLNTGADYQGDFAATYINDVDVDVRRIGSEDVTYIFVADQAGGLSVVEMTDDGPAHRGSLPLYIPFDQCPDPSPVNEESCATVAKRIKIDGDIAYCATSEGMFTVSLGIGN